MSRFSKLETVNIKKAAEDFYKDNEESLDARESFLKANEEFFTGNYENAVKYFSKSLQLDNTKVDAWVGQVFALLNMREYREADLWAKQGLMLFPENGDLLAIKASVYANKGFLNQAIGASDYSLEKGQSPNVWICRGEVLLYAKNKNSFFCFEKALETAGAENWQVPMKIGMLFFRHKIPSTALKYLTKACNANPNNYYLWYLISRCNYLLKYKEKAIEAVKRSLSINPNYKDSQKFKSKLTRFAFLSFFIKTLF